MHQDQYRLLGENVAKLRTDLMKEQLSTFRSQLEDFARKHKVLNRLSTFSLHFLNNLIAYLYLVRLHFQEIFYSEFIQLKALIFMDSF